MKAINKAGNLKRITTHVRRRTKQLEARARQAHSALFSPAERLEQLNQQGHTALKERKRLMKQR